MRQRKRTTTSLEEYDKTEFVEKEIEQFDNKIKKEEIHFVKKLRGILNDPI